MKGQEYWNEFRGRETDVANHDKNPDVDTNSWIEEVDALNKQLQESAVSNPTKSTIHAAFIRHLIKATLIAGSIAAAYIALEPLLHYW
jgi:hypothetical protein